MDVSITIDSKNFAVMSPEQIQAFFIGLSQFASEMYEPEFADDEVDSKLDGMQKTFDDLDV